MILVVVDKIFQKLVWIVKNLLFRIDKEPAFWVNFSVRWLFRFLCFYSKEYADQFKAQYNTCTRPQYCFHFIETRYLNFLDGCNSFIESWESFCKLSIGFIFDSLDFCFLLRCFSLFDNHNSFYFLGFYCLFSYDFLRFVYFN